MHRGVRYDDVIIEDYTRAGLSHDTGTRRSPQRDDPFWSGVGFVLGRGGSSFGVP